ncbi:hypothetical protein DP939_41245 [Spongiactinospora rosea]|uniref:Uncharacterized protein n=1 Tax=Spongiactinospora rosea TaxID=2248750 RepID=A0A366LLK7_9ACTN|nr:hypothetical protein [Spongiactinospora rosea]RBQ14383.1 hypothetical protein DP939_41245 [Spongiactinospora rosea]
MTTELEKSLAAEFEQAARYAPRPVGDLRGRVEDGYRRRRRRGTALYAAAAVVVLTAGGTYAVNGVAPRDPEIAERPVPAVTPTATSAPDKVFPPIEKVWPDAVHSIPATLPNGRAFRPEAFLDDRTILARTLKDGHADKMDGLWAYDIGSRTAKRLVAVTPPPRTTVTASVISAGGGRLAWWTARKVESRPVVDIWTAPASGGAQRKVATFGTVPHYGGIDMEIVGDKAVWSPWGGSGVYEVPLTGGRPKPVPGAMAHYTLLVWPWAGVPRPDALKRSSIVAFSTLVNLETRRRLGRATAPKGAFCAATWCVLDRSAFRRDDGTERPLPGRIDSNGVELDRFVTLLQSADKGRLRGQVLYDLSTGRAGDLGIRPVKVKPRPGSKLKRESVTMPVAVLDYRQQGLFGYESGDSWVVVNLRRIK